MTRLPLDATHEEIVSCFSKCGLIEEDDDGEPKVKMYARETDDGSNGNGNGNGAGGGGGEFSGEALVVYFKEDSVELAVNILDDTELRLGDDTTRMRVQRAEFGHKGEGGGGSGAPGSASGKGERTRKVVDKRKTTRRLGKMQKYVVLDYHYRLVEDCTDDLYCGRKLEEWDDEDNFGPSLTDADRLGPGPQGAGANPNSRVVVLRHMFTLEELEKDATLLLDLKEDVREECETLGEVTNVVLYDVRVFLSFYIFSHASTAFPVYQRICTNETSVRCSLLGFGRAERARRGHDGQVPRPSQRPGMRHRTSTLSLHPYYPLLT